MAILAFSNRYNPNSYKETLCHRLLQLATMILKSLDTWSPSFVPYAINDSIEKRFWVDKPQANELMLSIFSAFGELSLPTENMVTSANLLYTPREGLPVGTNLKKVEMNF